MDETLAELGEHIQAHLGDALDGYKVEYGELTLLARASEIVQVVRFLRDDSSCQFVNLTDLCGVDWPQRTTASTWSTTSCRRSRTCASA